MNAQQLIRMALRLLMRNAHKLIPSEPLRRREPTPKPSAGPNKLRLHLFSADFSDPASARAFCFAPPGPDLPVPLTQELSGAFIDPQEVEVISEPIADRLSEFLSDADVDDNMLRLAGDNTLIIITENAFGGLPYDLDDTDTLSYLGVQVVDV